MSVAMVMSSSLAEKGGTAEDRLLVAGFGRLGLAVELVAWDGGADWGGFEAVLLRSCWDYHLRPQAFREWLERMERLRIPFWNPVPQVRWNMDKRYLLELAERGVPVVPTIVVDQGSDGFGDWAQALGVEELVIKPVIGATAFGCRRVSRRGDLGEAMDPQATGPWLVQPFVPEVVWEGEWSLIWLGGGFSHAVLKRPRIGEYRVQSQWGGSVERRIPDDALLAAARKALGALDQEPLYARIDLVRREGEALLMEMELIEPELFLKSDDPGIEALVERVRG